MTFSITKLNDRLDHHQIVDQILSYFINENLFKNDQKFNIINKICGKFSNDNQYEVAIHYERLPKREEEKGTRSGGIKFFLFLSNNPLHYNNHNININDIDNNILNNNNNNINNIMKILLILY